MKVALYARVSTDEQHTDVQLEQLRPWVTAQGWRVVAEYRDTISGTAVTRSGLDALMKDARTGKFQAVVVVKIDRLGRSLAHLLAILSELESHGVHFAASTQAINTATAAGRMVLHFLGAIAEFERELIRERTNAGLARARARGKRLGRPCADLDPDRLADLCAQDLSQREIARRLGVGQGTVRRAVARLRRNPPDKSGL